MKSTIFYILIVLFIFSCKNEFEVPDTGRKMVINGLITTDSIIGICVTKSLYISDSTKWLGTDKIIDANAIIYEDEHKIDSLIYQTNISLGGGGAYLQTPVNYRGTALVPALGKEYKLTIKAPGFPDAHSITRIPNIVKIERMDTSVVKLSGTFEEWQSNIRLVCDVQFTDPENVKNYYLFYVYRGVDDFRGLNMEFTCNDPVIEEKLNHGTRKFGVAFSDKSINGKTHRLTVILDGTDIGMPFWNDNYPFPPHKTTLYFRLYSITDDYFKYIQTLNLFLKNYKNPLAEPTQVHSNVTGGYGIFAGAAVSSDSIVFMY